MFETKFDFINKAAEKTCTSVEFNRLSLLIMALGLMSLFSILVLGLFTLTCTKTNRPILIFGNEKLIILLNKTRPKTRKKKSLFAIINTALHTSIKSVNVHVGGLTLSAKQK